MFIYSFSCVLNLRAEEEFRLLPEKVVLTRQDMQRLLLEQFRISRRSGSDRKTQFSVKEHVAVVARMVRFMRAAMEKR